MQFSDNIFLQGGFIRLKEEILVKGFEDSGKLIVH